MNHITLKTRGLYRFGCGIFAAAAVLFIIFLILDRIWPIDLVPETRARVILANDGTPLRAFADEKGVWRYPVSIDEVSSNYIEALVGYEDKWFYRHPGVNPFSLARAGYQWAKTGRIVSGGSTLTMQVARMRRPVPRTVTGKLVQIFTALQLEWHYDKNKILTCYLNHAPFGGTFEGILAACYAYFDHDARNLTHAQAALLAVLPQAPSRYRPDRYPEAAERARNKLMERLQAAGIWSAETVLAAKMEKVTGWPVESRMNAPLLARRLHHELPETESRIKTNIDYHLQLAMEQLAVDYISTMPPGVSCAVLCMNNTSGSVEACVASADFLNNSRFGHVDMVTALRSPGSTMKPFIYGLALDQGLLHSQSLLMDVPIRFGNYQPVNFHRSFSGPVSLAKALSKSLNLPAVQVLDHLGPRFFYARMVNAGFKISLPAGAGPNLSMALGGFSTSLENLVSAYSSLGSGGFCIRPKYLRDESHERNRLLSEGAAWIIQDILREEKTPGPVQNTRSFAVKTGTSYGFRDAWAIGVDKEYTTGAWVGRPDGMPVPEHFGAQTAVPLLTMAFQLLPSHQSRIKRPESVTGRKICWPDGRLASYGYPETERKCDEIRNAWILDETAPATLTPYRKDTGPAVINLPLTLTPDKKWRIPSGCNLKKPTLRATITLWPVALEAWIPASLRRSAVIPPLCPECGLMPSVAIDEPVTIEGINDGEIIMNRGRENDYPVFDLSVQGGSGPWYWFENSILKKTGREFSFVPSHPGEFQLLVVDQSGETDKVEVKVF